MNMNIPKLAGPKNPVNLPQKMTRLDLSSLSINVDHMHKFIDGIITEAVLRHPSHQGHWVRKEVEEAFCSISSLLKMIPHVLSGTDVATILSDPSILLDYQQVKLYDCPKHFTYVFEFMKYAYDRINRDGMMAGATFLFSLVQIIQRFDDQNANIERLVRNFVDHFGAWLDELILLNPNDPDVTSGPESLQGQFKSKKDQLNSR